MRELRLDDSSNVRRLKWMDNFTLEVEFSSGAVYRYANVQQHQLAEAVAAPSVGSWVSKTLVRNPTTYPVTKVKSPEDAEREDAEKKLTADLSLSAELGGAQAKLTAGYVKALTEIAGDRFSEALDAEALEMRQIAQDALNPVVKIKRVKS